MMEINEEINEKMLYYNINFLENFLKFLKINRLKQLIIFSKINKKWFVKNF